MKTKVTFKKYEEIRGLAGVGYSKRSADIKINKKIVGTIQAPNWQTKDNKWSIFFNVMKDQPDSNPNCRWKNICLKARFDEYEEAKQFVIDNIDKIEAKFILRYQEETWNQHPAV